MSRRLIAFVGVLTVVCAFAFQGSRGIYESTEGRYSLCALEMVESGNWLEPTLKGEPHWTKPPLGYWNIAAGLTLLGRHEWGARLGNSVCLALTVLLVGLLGRCLWDSRTGLLAALVYATSAFPVMAAFTINTDTLLCLWEVAAVLGFAAFARASTPGRRQACILGMWLAFGLAFFTKGPVGLLPLLAIISWWALQGRQRRPAGLFWWPAVVLFVLVGFGWYLAMVVKYPHLLGYFVGDEIVNRVASDKFGRNPEWYQPFKLYLPELLLGGGVWSWWLYRLAREQRAWRRAFWRQLWNDRGPALFLVLWVIPALAVFAVSRSRLPLYVLPLFPAIALAIAWRLRQDWAAPATALPRRFVASACIMGGLLLCVKGVSGNLPDIALRLGLRDGGRNTLFQDQRRDMRALYRLAAPFDDPRGTRFAFFEQDGEYGFDFYARSPVYRLFTLPEKAQTAKGAGLFRDYLATAMRPDLAAGRRTLFIVRPQALKVLAAGAATAGLKVHVLSQGAHWQVAELRPE